jgi:hypothetical protein
VAFFRELDLHRAVSGATGHTILVLPSNGSGLSCAAGADHPTEKTIRLRHSRGAIPCSLGRVALQT